MAVITPRLPADLVVKQYATADGRKIDLPAKVLVMEGLWAYIYEHGFVSSHTVDTSRRAILSRAHPSAQGTKVFFAFWMEVFHEKADHSPALAELFLKLSHRKIIQDPMNPYLFFDREHEIQTNDGQRAWPLLKLEDDCHLVPCYSSAENAIYHDPCYVLAQRPAIKFHYLTEPQDHEFECTAGINIGEITYPGEPPQFFETFRFADEYLSRPPEGATITYLFDKRKIDQGIFY